MDNIWIERFWKSIKYDYIYLNPADDVLELYSGVQEHTSPTTTIKRTRQQNGRPYLALWKHQSGSVLLVVNVYHR
jgi:hypothetical protein